MSGKVLATDLDGTLFYPKRFRHCICRKNIKFLQDWIDNGNRLVLVTSRSTEFLEKLKKEIQRPFDMISCTSSRIVIDGEVVKDDGIDNVALKTILHDIEEKYHPRSFIMSTRDYPNILYDNGTINFFFAIIYKLWWIFQFAYREPYIVKNEVFHSEVDRGKVYRILIFFGLARNNNKISKDLHKAI